MIAFLPGGLVPPPSPFQRSTLRRFREDTWPRWRDHGARFWASPYRNFVLAACALLVVAAFGLSLRRLDPIEGQVVLEGGAGAAGTTVETAWYLSQLRGFENELRPLTFTYDQPNDALADQSILRRARVVAGPDGRFGVAGGWALGWPGWKGPFLSLRLRAADTLSGKTWPVPRFRLGDRSEVAGGFDSALSAGKDVGHLLGRLEIEAPRVRDIAVRGDDIATAEGIAGVRLYRLTEASNLELVAHRPGSEGLLAHGVGFLEQGIVVFSSRGLELLDATSPALETRERVTGPFRRLLGAAADGIWVATADAVHRLVSDTPIRVVERLSFGDPGQAPERVGPDVLRLSGQRLLYLHGDGSLRLVNLGSAFRTPATLLDRGGAVVDFDLADDGRIALVASKSGVTTYSVANPETLSRLGEERLETRPLAVRGRAVIGESGIVVLALGPTGIQVERTVPLALSEIEAASSYLRDDDLVVPWLGPPDTHAEEREVSYDPLSGNTAVRREVRRDAADLLGVRILDLVGGSLFEKRLDRPVRLRIRPDGHNAQLVSARLPDGRAVFAEASGRLVIEPWSAPGAR